MPKYYLVSGSLVNVVKDMFIAELQKNIISLQKVKPTKENPKSYYLIWYEPNEEISWWINYVGLPRIDKIA